MTIRIINHHFSVSGPLTESDISTLKEAGVTALINCRPDSEVPDPPNSQLQVWVKQAGLDYHFVPVTTGHYSDADIERFGQILLKAKGRVHGVCRTGTRALHLWALARAAQGLSENEIKQAGMQVGVDLNDVLSSLRRTSTLSRNVFLKY